MVMDPATRLHYVEVAEPDMHEPSGDLQRLERALAEQWGIENAKGDLRTLQMLQPALRKGDWKVTCAVHRDGPEARILQVWPGYYDGAIYGLAIDVGSTTIAGHLCDLATGTVLASTGLMNPQIRFGEDLMSRVSYAMLNPGGAAAMTRAVRDALNAPRRPGRRRGPHRPRADLRGGDRRQPGHAPPRARHRPDRARPWPLSRSPPPTRCTSGPRRSSSACTRTPASTSCPASPATSAPTPPPSPSPRARTAPTS